MELISDTLPYIVFKIVVFVICVPFVRQCLVLRDTDHNFSAIVVDVVAMGDRRDVKFCTSVVMG